MRCALCAVISFFITAPVEAQEIGPEAGGPVIVGGGHEWKSFEMKPVNLTLDLLGRHQIDQFKPKGPAAGPKRQDTQTFFREALGIRTGGFIGHPNFMDIDLSGTFGLSQEELRSDTLGVNERNLESVIEYDASVLVLRESEWPLRVYSTRSQLFIDRQFADTIDSITTQHGAFLQWRSPSFPSTFHLFHREEEQTSRLNNFDFNLVQDTFEWSTQWQPDDGQHLTWDYSFDNVQQGGMLRQPTNLQRHNAFLTHSFDFGMARQHNLRSSMAVFHETGDFPSDRVRWDEALRLRHTPRFETLYNYSLDWLQTPAADQLLHRGTAGFRHRLFESLVSSGTVGVNYLEVSPSDFTSREIFARLHLDYTKRVPYGRLSAGVFGSVSHQDDTEQGAPIQVLDDQRVFGTSGIVILNRRNVNSASIVVTDATGFIVYTEGVDYVVSVFGDQVEIRRILGGNITEGEAVLVDYVINPEPAAITNTVGAGSSVRYDIEEGALKGLGFFIRYFHQDQDRSPELSTFPANNIDEVTFGADYRILYVTLRGEHQIRESTISPFEATRLDATYLHPLGRGSTLTLNATYDVIDRTEEQVESTIMTLGARWNQMITERLNMNLSVLWRDEDDSRGLDVQGFEQRLDLNWRYRQTTVYGSIRNAILESNTSDSLFQTFMVGLRREF